MAELQKKEKFFKKRSSSPPAPKQPQIRSDSPTIHLRGENLEYYRNIAYLKEVTRQANALLDRSNAKYENILDDQKLGYRVRAKSSDIFKPSAEEAENKCKKCGLAHGAVDFCIVEKIMDSEKQNEEKQRKFKTSRASNRLSDSESLKNKVDSTIHAYSKREQQPYIWGKINILEKMTPSQILDTYECLCARYGPNAGRQFLLANFLAHPLEGKIEPWMTSLHQSKRMSDLMTGAITQYDDLSRDCPTAKFVYRPLCPNTSPDVREKMEMIAHLVPPCDVQLPHNQEKNWRAVFRKHPAKRKPVTPQGYERNSDKFEFESSSSKEECNCKVQPCACGTEKICTTPNVKKKCNLISYEDGYDNNYLLTMRKKIWKQRETKRQETLMLTKATFTDVNSKRKSEDFLECARLEEYKTIQNCLSKKVKDDSCDDKEFEKNVQGVAEGVAPHTAINPRQLDRWLEQLKEQEKIEEEDEIESMSSDMPSDKGTESLISHSSTFKVGGIKHTRIPCAEEISNLIDKLYDKITRKFEKVIVKNSFKLRRLSYKPTYAYFHQRMTMLSFQNPHFQEIMHLARFDHYRKRLTPFKVKKYRKLKRLEAMERRLARTQRIRNMARGVQLGKQYRKVSRSREYAAESGYRAFEERERKVLDPNMPGRFAKFNITRNLLGKAITKKNIHHDFRLMCSMFEDAAKARREDLMDLGMLRRLHEFQEKMQNVKQLPCPPQTDSDIEGKEADSDHSGPLVDAATRRKEDTQLLKKSNGEPAPGVGNLSKQWSYENFHLSEEIRCAMQLRSGKSNSTSNESKEPNQTATRQKLRIGKGIPEKCMLSITVEGEQSKHNKNPKHGKNDAGSKMNRLLPPLISHSAKPSVNNEFQENISALQNELAYLINHPNNVSKVAAPVQIGETRQTRSISKRLSSYSRLPELKAPPRKAKSKNMRKISDESLPHIKGRGSMGNTDPGDSQEKFPRLTQKTLKLSIQSGMTKPRVSGTLPFLVEKS